MASTLGNLLTIFSPKRKAKSGGQSVTSTYNSNSPDRVLTLPQYREHLTDLFETRVADDSRELLKYLFQHDPDVSGAVFSYLTLANTPMIMYVRDLEGEIDRDATRELLKAVQYLTRPTDYTQGFQLKPNLSSICEELRYMALLRGGVAAELVFDKQVKPSQIRVVDTASLRWYETTAGHYKPKQSTGGGSSNEVDLDIPTFFTSFFRRDPTSIYTKSIFVSAINTIAARQQVINDLYRIMKKTGYPRMAVKVVEEVLRKNMPETAKADEQATKVWLTARMAEINNALVNMRPDNVFVHSDAVEPYIVNEKQPGVAVDISKVIETLNSQNQAGLKTMATVIGRGTQGVNTGSVEARIAAMNADELNQPVVEVLQDIFSLLIHMNGIQGFVEVRFAPAELRPDLELEAQRTMRAARLRKDLSDGLITDDEYHLWVYGRLRPDAAPLLAGTKFLTGPDMIDAEGVSPNGDPLGRSITSKDQSMAKSDTVQETADAHA